MEFIGFRYYSLRGLRLIGFQVCFITIDNSQLCPISLLKYMGAHMMIIPKPIISWHLCIQIRSQERSTRLTYQEPLEERRVPNSLHCTQEM